MYPNEKLPLRKGRFALFLTAGLAFSLGMANSALEAEKAGVISAGAKSQRPPIFREDSPDRFRVEVTSRWIGCGFFAILSAGLIWAQWKTVRRKKRPHSP